jgi:hypothetical protein
MKLNKAPNCRLEADAVKRRRVSYYVLAPVPLKLALCNK